MVRPRKIRWVNFHHGFHYFKPRAMPLSSLQEVIITVDELETMRLANLEKLSQEEAASRMNIHQSTFQRTLTRAREKVTDALVNGKAIRIQGGDFAMPGGDGTGPLGQGPVAGRGQGRIQNTGRGRMGGSLAAGPGGVCICPKCGYEKPHVRGQPCIKMKCPKCETMMARG